VCVAVWSVWGVCEEGVCVCVPPDLDRERPLKYKPTHASPQGFDKAQRDALGRRIKVANTLRLYKQNRFNLMHEESEGYSKAGLFL
jgi:hypothetical protein